MASRWRRLVLAQAVTICDGRRPCDPRPLDQGQAGHGRLQAPAVAAAAIRHLDRRAVAQLAGRPPAPLTEPRGPARADAVDSAGTGRRRRQRRRGGSRRARHVRVVLESRAGPGAGGSPRPVRCRPAGRIFGEFTAAAVGRLGRAGRPPRRGSGRVKAGLAHRQAPDELGRRCRGPRRGLVDVDLGRGLGQDGGRQVADGDAHVAVAEVDADDAPAARSSARRVGGRPWALERRPGRRPPRAPRPGRSPADRSRGWTPSTATGPSRRAMSARLTVPRERSASTTRRRLRARRLQGPGARGSMAPTLSDRQPVCQGLDEVLHLRALCSHELRPTRRFPALPPSRPCRLDPTPPAGRCR